MFTGLVETVGAVDRLDRHGAGGRLHVDCRWDDADPPQRGDSIAVNGACLTAVAPETEGFAADLSPETLDRTLLGGLSRGDPVNLERALRLGDRVGGHLVQGHVDAVVRVLFIRPEGAFSRWRFSLPAALAPEVAVKGSVAVHGVSLTVADCGDDWFEVALIPETLKATTLHRMRAGARVHLETDVLAKYVARQAREPGRSTLTELFGDGLHHA
jgi:riboflavin synthase